MERCYEEVARKELSSLYAQNVTVTRVGASYNRGMFDPSWLQGEIESATYTAVINSHHTDKIIVSGNASHFGYSIKSYYTDEGENTQ